MSELRALLGELVIFMDFALFTIPAFALGDWLTNCIRRTVSEWCWEKFQEYYWDIKDI